MFWVITSIFSSWLTQFEWWKDIKPLKRKRQGHSGKYSSLWSLIVFKIINSFYFWFIIYMTIKSIKYLNKYYAILLFNSIQFVFWFDSKSNIDTLELIIQIHIIEFDNVLCFFIATLVMYISSLICFVKAWKILDNWERDL